MASEYVQELAFRQVSEAIMSTANSVAGAVSGDAGGGIFDVVRRKLGKVQDVITGMAAPLKRRSMYEELPEHVWPTAVPEAIEMSHIVQRGKGHTFVPCHLTNPTWCDYCGDFIWGLYKQCMRCQTCQYTCHQHCVPAVNLNCKSIQHDSAAIVSASANVSPASASSSDGSERIPVGNHADLRGCPSGPVSSKPSPPSSTQSHQPRPRLEQSRSLGQLGSRPGVATRLVPVGEAATGNVSDFSQQQHHPLMHDECSAGVGSVRVVSSQLASSSSSSSSPSSSAFSSPHHQKHLTRSASEGYVCVTPAQRVGDFQDLPSDQQQTHIPTLQSHRQHNGSSNSSSPARRPDTPPPSPSELRRSSLSHLQQEQHLPSPTRNVRDGEIDGRHLEGELSTAASEVPTEQDETDSGYRSGTIPDDKLPPIPSQALLDIQELKKKITKYNHFVPAASFEATDNGSFQGFLKVTMNLIRPITMELGARPPSIYELLTREHIVEENTQHVAFYMPRDTHKSLHITSETTTKEVVASLLKKFHILDHPRKFAMYDQEFSDKNKLVRLRRLNDKDFPLRAILDWDPERIHNYRLVLQENETGEIVWDAFSLPELNNFMRVLDKEEKETIIELRHKYAYMRQFMERRLAEFRGEKRKSKA